MLINIIKKEFHTQFFKYQEKSLSLQTEKAVLIKLAVKYDRIARIYIAFQKTFPSEILIIDLIILKVDLTF